MITSKEGLINLIKTGRLTKQDLTSLGILIAKIDIANQHVNNAIFTTNHELEEQARKLEQEAMAEARAEYEKSLKPADERGESLLEKVNECAPEIAKRAESIGKIPEERDLFLVVEEMLKVIPISEETVGLRKDLDWHLNDLSFKPPEQRNQGFFWRRIGETLENHIHNDADKIWEKKIANIWMGQTVFPEAQTDEEKTV